MRSSKTSLRCLSKNSLILTNNGSVTKTKSNRNLQGLRISLTKNTRNFLLRFTIIRYFFILKSPG
jgi:hypothetical protein